MRLNVGSLGSVDFCSTESAQQIASSEVEFMTRTRVLITNRVVVLVSYERNPCRGRHVPDSPQIALKCWRPSGELVEYVHAEAGAEHKNNNGRISNQRKTAPQPATDAKDLEEG